MQQNSKLKRIATVEVSLSQIRLFWLELAKYECSGCGGAGSCVCEGEERLWPKYGFRRRIWYAMVTTQINGQYRLDVRRTKIPCPNLPRLSFLVSSPWLPSLPRSNHNQARQLKFVLSHLWNLPRIGTNTHDQLRHLEFRQSSIRFFTMVKMMQSKAFAILLITPHWGSVISKVIFREIFRKRLRWAKFSLCQEGT